MMKTTQDRLASIFSRCRQEKSSALVIYITCGCPDFEASEALIDQVIASGADIVELGVPFSDPMADGAVIQKASQIALGNGANFRRVLELAGRIRSKHPETGLVVFSYFNVLLNYGLEAFGTKMAELDLDGVLAVDVPFEERAELEDICIKYHKHRIPLVSPVTDAERMKKITQGASGFIYYVMVKGITGARAALPEDVATHLDTLRKIAAPCPVVAGFGVASGAMAQQLSGTADGVVSGSAVMRFMLDETLPVAERIDHAAALVAELSRGVRNQA